MTCRAGLETRRVIPAQDYKFVRRNRSWTNPIRCTTLEAQIDLLRAEFAVQEIASIKIIGQEKTEKAQLAQGRVDMGLSRRVDATENRKKRRSK